MMIRLPKEQPQLEVELLACVINESACVINESQNESQKGQPQVELLACIINKPQVTLDLTPQGSICDWCGQTGERRLTAIGGSFHNKSGIFCNPCGQLFLGRIVDSRES